MSNSKEQSEQKPAEKFERVHLGTKVERQYGLKNSEGDVVQTFYVQASTPRGSTEQWTALKDLIDKEANKKQAELEAQLNDGNS